MIQNLKMIGENKTNFRITQRTTIINKYHNVIYNETRSNISFNFYKVNTTENEIYMEIHTS